MSEIKRGDAPNHHSVSAGLLGYFGMAVLCSARVVLERKLEDWRQ